MLLNLFEITEEVIHHNKAEGQKLYHIREVVVNRRFITFMREDFNMVSHLKDGRLPATLPSDQKFTRISIARGNIGQDITVVGDLQHITNMFNQDDRKRTLKG